MQNSHHFTTLKICGITLKTNIDESSVILKVNSVIFLKNIIKHQNEIFFIGQKHEKIEELYKLPVSYFKMDTYLVENLSNLNFGWNVEIIKHKALRLPTSSTSNH